MGELINFSDYKKTEEVVVEPISNYTGYGTEGSKYKEHKYTDIKEIAKMVRKRIKKDCPECKFSINIQRYAGGQSMDVALMSGPFDAFTNFQDDTRSINEFRLFDEDYSEKSKISTGAVDALRKIMTIVKEYNYDDSDSMIDYFNVNFYTHLSIGKWNKAFVKTEV